MTSPAARARAGARRSRRAAAGRAELLAKRGHTGRVQNPAKVSENRPACGTAQHTLAVCFVFEKLEKSRKYLVKIWRKFSKTLAKFCLQTQQNFQQFLTRNIEKIKLCEQCKGVQRVVGGAASGAVFRNTAGILHAPSMPFFS